MLRKLLIGIVSIGVITGCSNNEAGNKEVTNVSKMETSETSYKEPTLEIKGEDVAKTSLEDYLNLIKEGNKQLAMQNYLRYDQTVLEVLEYHYVKTTQSSEDKNKYMFTYDIKLPNGQGQVGSVQVDFVLTYDSKEKRYFITYLSDGSEREY